MDLQSLFSVAAGLIATAVYFYLYNKAFDISRRLPTGAAQGLLIFGYLVRLAAVGLILLGAVYVAGLDTLPVGVAFMVSFTGVFIYTQGRAVRHLMTGRLTDRKE